MNTRKALEHVINEEFCLFSKRKLRKIAETLADEVLRYRAIQASTEAEEEYEQ